MEKFNFKNVKFIQSLFEEYQTNEEFDYCFCLYVLEHVFSPIDLLINIKKWLKKGGILFAVVPNAFAFSRQLAQKLNLIINLKDLTENDKRHGHRRVYDRFTIKRDFVLAGFDLIERKGVIFKILADFQLNYLLNNGILSNDHINALHQLSNGNEVFCDSILIIAKK